MSPKRAYWLAFVVFGLSAAVGVTLDLTAEAVDIGTAVAAAGTVAIIYGVVIAFCDPDRARFPSDWGSLEHGVAAAELYTVGIAF